MTFKHFAIIFSLLFLSLPPLGSARADELYLTINGEDIFESEIDALAAEAGMDPETAKNDANAIKQIQSALVNRVLVFQEAKNRNIQETQAYLEATERLLLQTFLDQLREEKVTDEVIAKLYLARVEQDSGKRSYHAAHILVETEEEAKAAIERVNAGEDFAELARELSKDPGSGSLGGDLGFFDPAVMVKSFGDAVVALDDGELSAPVESQFGWHVIRRFASRIDEVAPLDEIRDQLAQEAFDDVVSELIAQLRSSATIVEHQEE